MSSVFNGGIIGKVNNPTLSSASGVWGLREHLRAKRDNVWPGGETSFDYILNTTGYTSQSQTWTTTSRIPQSAFLNTPTLGVTKAILTVTSSITECWIGNRDMGSADGDDATDLTQVFFNGGSASVSQSVNQYTVSDEVDFVWDGSSDILVCIYGPSPLGYKSVAGITGYYEFGDIASDLTKTFSGAIAGRNYNVTAIQLNGFVPSA